MIASTPSSPSYHPPLIRNHFRYHPPPLTLPLPALITSTSFLLSPSAFAITMRVSPLPPDAPRRVRHPQRHMSWCSSRSTR
eukprot:1306215-Pleurochrysis_carterae.AAC.1